MLAKAPCFTITGQLGREKRSKTRMAAASAMVLADQWAAEGCRNVCVADPDGICRDRPAFRATLPLIKRLNRSTALS